jgi:hypothetical protein
MKLTCVDCGSDRIHRSRRRNWLDRAVLLCNGRTCRCHACNARYARFGHVLVRIGAVRRAAGRMALAFMMMTAAAIVLAGIIWLSHTQASSGGGETQGELAAPGLPPGGQRV